MPWFIVQCERKTWTKYIVEAEDQDAALEDTDDWEYFGYLDGEDTDHSLVAGPFYAQSAAFADASSYVDGT